MPGNRIIQVTLPEGAEPTREDLELLQGIFEAVVTLRFRQSRMADEVECALAAEGWDVRSRLVWVAEAKKGSEHEEATGLSKADALTFLHRLVKADQVMSPP